MLTLKQQICYFFITFYSMLFTYSHSLNFFLVQFFHSINVLASVVRRLDNAIHWIKLYPVVKAIYLAITYLPDSDLSIG